MNQHYKILCSALLAVLLLVFIIALFDRDATYSETEQRELLGKPKLTVSAILDGSWWKELQLYFADTFPGREALLDDFAEMNKFYNFGDKESEEIK